MMRILLFGKRGQLGWELHRQLIHLGEVTALDQPDVDFSSPESLRPLIREIEPTLIINAAAYTAVDRAEEEQDLARQVNAVAPSVLAEEASKLGAGLIHYSTDYIFDGSSGTAYREEDESNPINTYGRTKLDGERAIAQQCDRYWILRTSWVYSFRGPSFAQRVLTWARSKKQLEIVTDQVGSPTWCRTLAIATTYALLGGNSDTLNWIAKHTGIYHVAGKGQCSRHDFAQELVRCDPRREEQCLEEILPAKSEQFPSLAKRPPYTPLNCDRFESTFGVSIPDWKVALRLAVEEYA